MNFKKYFLLLIIFDFFALFLVFQESALAGCADQYYYTQCDDKVTIGRCCWGSADGTCCSEHEECEEICDEEGNCTEKCQDVCDSWCRECSCNKSWYEYSCGSSKNCVCNDGDPQCCDGDINRRKCYSKQEGNCSMGSCESESCHFDRCDPSEPCEECQSWQKPVRAGCGSDCTKWGTTRPECKCCGECIKAPDGLQEYQTPDSSIPADTPAKLPIKLDWNDVPGLWTGWSGGGSTIQEYADCQRGYIDFCWEEAKALNPGWRCQGEITDEYLVCLRRETKANCEEKLEEDDACKKTCPALEEGGDECFDPDEFVKSYVIYIEGDLRSCDDGSDMSSDTAVLGISEFFAPCSCYFKSNRTYAWKVKACCTEDGNNCGPWSESMTFKTSLAPELISPYDPDWAGPAGRENLSFEDSRELQWCRAEDPTYYYETEGRYVPLSYKIQIYYLKNGGYICHPLLGIKDGECIPAYLQPDVGVSKRLPPDKFLTEGLVTKESSYAWQVAACRDDTAFECSNYSQEWRFSTAEWKLTVTLSAPPNNAETPIGLPVRLRWSSPYANSFNYKIYIKDGPLVAEGRTKEYEMTLHYKNMLPLALLELDTIYTWYVQPCHDFEAKECENFWGGPWHFRTTGRPPQLLYPEAGETDILISVNFNWEDMPGARSYVLWIQGNGLDEEIIVNNKSEFSMNFPEYNILPERDYSWQVKTCAEPGGETCGVYSASRAFRTFEWEEPSGEKPEDGAKIDPKRPYTISWEEVRGAKYYQYEVRLVAVDDDDPREECKKLESPKTIAQGITSRLSTTLDLKCWGAYEWNIAPCLDKECNVAGPESKTWIFNFKAEFLPPETKPGLIPCNQAFYNPNTPWDETRPCGIEHLFIMLYMLINFFWWKVIPLILILLALASGVIFYFSGQFGIPDPLAQVKALWKAAGIGLAVIFLAWTIISLFLTIFGYRVGLFGPWWQI